MQDDRRFTVTVRRRVRPLRFAFVVDPDDAAMVRRAFELNTILWGGRFNPVVPFFNGAVPRAAKGKPLTAAEAANRCLALFEPDYVIELGTTKHAGLAVSPSLHLLAADQALGDTLGMRVETVFAHEYDERQRFVQRQPEPAALPKFRDFPLLSAAAFGAFGERGERAAMHYRHTFEAEERELDRVTLRHYLADLPLTPIDATAEGLRFHSSADLILYFCDPASTLDAIELWNLRALGGRIIPAPQDWPDTDAWLELVENVRGGAIVLKSLASSGRRWRRFAARFREHRFANHVVVRDGIAPLWLPDDGDGARSLAVWEEEDELEVPAENGVITLPLRAPEFAVERDLLWRHHWANDVELRSFDSDSDRYATTFPPLRDVAALLGWNAYGVVQRRGGLSLFAHEPHERKVLVLPAKERVVEAWMRDRGFEMAVSSAGRIAQQVVRAIGGLRLAWLIGNVDLLAYLNGLAHTSIESDVPADAPAARRRVRVGTASRSAVVEVLKRVARAADRHPTSATPEWIARAADERLKALLERSVLRLGLKLQCRHCAQRNWYPLDELGEEVRCERCLQTFAFPVAEPQEAEWEYRPIGPFAVENYAQGAYAAVLALRFLTQEQFDDAVWTPAFTLTRDGRTIEHDFGLFVRDDVATDALTFVGGECKCGDRRFGDKDFDACTSFAAAFPGAAFVFVTTRGELDAREQRSIRALARRGRAIRDGRWRTPIAVLTRLRARSAVEGAGAVARTRRQRRARRLLRRRRPHDDGAARPRDAAPLSRHVTAARATSRAPPPNPPPARARRRSRARRASGR